MSFYFNPFSSTNCSQCKTLACLNNPSNIVPSDNFPLDFTPPMGIPTGMATTSAATAGSIEANLISRKTFIATRDQF